MSRSDTNPRHEHTSYKFSDQSDRQKYLVESHSDEKLHTTKKQKEENNNAYSFVMKMCEIFMAPTIMYDKEEKASAVLRLLFTNYYSNPEMQTIRKEIESNEKYSKIIDTIYEFVTTMGTDRFDERRRVSFTNSLLISIKKISC